MFTNIPVVTNTGEAVPPNLSDSRPKPRLMAITARCVTPPIINLEYNRSSFTSVNVAVITAIDLIETQRLEIVFHFVVAMRVFNKH